MTGLSSVMSDQDDQEAGTFALGGKAVGFRCTKRTVVAGELSSNFLVTCKGHP